jgi:type III secretory pathway component EscV
MQRTSLLILAAGLGVLLLLVPVPAALLDLLLLANLGAGAALLLFAARAGHLRDLPALPTYLVSAMLARLGLLMAALRLVLGEREGGLPRAAADLLLGGEPAVGLSILLCLGVVQVLVLARGGERVAEVAARFALDALPGQQAAIEADLRAGALSPEQARGARAQLVGETQLYGAMDGALRFIKGDAAAGLVILGVGLAAGLLIGVGAQGLPVSEAFARYGLPLLGAALLTQVPVLFAAAAAGLVLTRGVGAGARAEAAAPRRETLLVEADPAFGLQPALLEAAAARAAQGLGLPAPVVELRAGGAGRLRISAGGICRLNQEGREGEGQEEAAAWLEEVVREVAPEWLGVDEVRRLLEALGAERPALVREAVPGRIGLGALCGLLRALLSEGVPLDVAAVLEALLSLPSPPSDAALLCEQVRGRLGAALLRGYLRAGSAALLAVPVDGEIEDLLREAPAGDVLAIEPDLCMEIQQGAAAARRSVPGAVLLCHGDVRRHLRRLLQTDPQAPPVLAYPELPARLEVRVVGHLRAGGFVAAS